MTESASEPELTNEYLQVIRKTGENAAASRSGGARSGSVATVPPGDAGGRLGATGYPLWIRLDWLREAVERMKEIVTEDPRPVPASVTRIVRVTDEPAARPNRPAGEGTNDQILNDFEQLRPLGAETVVLDRFGGDPEETCHPEVAWQTLATVAHRHQVPERTSS
ncbi:hypothetical protein [Streptomyces sp. NPDC086766]|uniref:hypothetical protein n=1 Tax=Streptomyces sp. NPDC086766 TaxID=3365754 RepID=UPI003823EF43